MATLSFNALLAGGKPGTLDPVYYLHGEEEILKEEAVRVLLDRAVEPSLRDFNLDARSAPDLDPAALRALVDTPPMMADRRVVILRSVEGMRAKSKARDELVRYLAHPNPTTTLILIQGGDETPDAGLTAHATTVAIDRLPPDRVARWIVHRAGQIGLKIDQPAALLLGQATGHDLAAISQELDKLAAVAGDRTVVEADVTALVGVRRGETLDALITAALERRAGDAARTLGAVLAQSGMSAVKLVSTLGTGLVGLAAARAELDRGTAPGRLEYTILQRLIASRPAGLSAGYKDVAARWARWAPLWTAPELSRAIRRALAADRALKGTQLTDDYGIVLDLILGLAREAKEAA
ncbi:MAG TPA: DNA polymerase III subunit delta [Gemmatimonadales bacterium]|nr:DNA polymerase III subunit delta [Gemmatimonadales bacterium]